MEFVLCVETNHLRIRTMDPKFAFPVGPFFADWFVTVQYQKKVLATNYQSKVLDSVLSMAKQGNFVDFVATKSVH